MPLDTAETPTIPDQKNVTIQGEVYTLSCPFREGHQLTAAQAMALNQLRHENIRNNVAGKIKSAAAKNETLDAAALVRDYDANYEFTVSSSSGSASRTLDPIEREARRLAREVLHIKIAEAGHQVKAYKEANPETYENLLDQIINDPETVKEAKATVKRKESAAKSFSNVKVPS